MADCDNEMLQSYIEESREHLADIENDLLTIEQRGADLDEELVNKVFRAAHSLKGGAGFFDLLKIKELAHKIENVLDMIRSRELVPNAEVVNILLISFDKLRELINHSEESNQADIDEFVVSLTGLASAYLPQNQKQTLIKKVDISVPGVKLVIQVSEFDLIHARQKSDFVCLLEYDLIHDIQRVGKTPITLLKELADAGTIIDCTVDIATVGTLDDEPSNKIPFYVVYGAGPDAVGGVLFGLDPERIHSIPNEVGVAAPAQQPPQENRAPQPVTPTPETHPNVDAGVKTEVKQAQPQKEQPKEADKTSRPRTETEHAPKNQAEVKAGQSASANQPETTLRVNVSLLESLMNLAGELVLSRNQMLEAIAQNDQRVIKAAGQRINIVTSELQEAIMITRMQPIGNILGKFPRVVRDLARDLGKEIRLDLSGQEVEMDKTIIEGLSDPLTHLIRNSVDHGIEVPSVRIASGKNALGVVTLKAYHEAGQVNIEISDDGKGMDPHKIASLAVTKGLITAEQVKTMSEKEMMALILLPGFSTAEKITDVSGRGVGMDVVKTNLDRLGGQVDIKSAPGEGSTFRIKLPLTLAIIPCLLVSVGKDRFAIPQVNVEELIHIEASQIKQRIEIVGDAEVLLLRGKLVPIVHLTDVLGISRPGASVNEREARSDLNIVVVTTGSQEYGLVVENLHDSVEIVVKPIGRHIKHLRQYAGATIMGDGKVALILDVAGLSQVAGLGSFAGTSRAMELATEAARDTKNRDIQSLLLFRNSPDEQCAVPLDLVERVEQIKAGDIEFLGGKKVMKYRDQSMPLHTLKEVADVRDLPEEGEPVVLVFEIGGKQIGLLGRTPVDVLETGLVIDQSALKQKGIMGSSIINGRTTLIIDMFELVETLHPDWSVEGQKARAAQGAANCTILLAEDSDFFRNHVKKSIEDDGYKVLAAEDGLAAWELLQEHLNEVSLVVTDIEMPRMDGYGLTRKIKGDPRSMHLPVIALTSLAGDEDIAKGKAAGVDDYQIKLDKDRLLQGIYSFLPKDSTAAQNETQMRRGA